MADELVTNVVRESYFLHAWLSLGMLDQRRLRAAHRLGIIRMLRRAGYTQAELCRTYIALASTQRQLT